MSQSVFKKAKLLTSIVCAFGITSNAIADEKVTVVSSFSIISDLLTQVGGDHVDVSTLVKVNSDAHVYSPTPKDALSVKNAQLLVMNGLGFEGWMPRFLESAHFSGTKVIASQGINVIAITDEDHHEEHDEEHEHEEHATEHDEHEHEEHATKHDEHDHDEHEYTRAITLS